MKSKNINDITLFRYLFCLDKRDLPQSILNWCNNIGSAIDSDRENAIRELSIVKGNCRNLVVFSKTFVNTMDKSYGGVSKAHPLIVFLLFAETVLTAPITAILSNGIKPKLQVLLLATMITSNLLWYKNWRVLLPITTSILGTLLGLNL